MCANRADELFPRGPRVGNIWLDVRSEGRPATLRDTGSQIELIMAYDRGDPIERRFLARSVRWGDDPDYELHNYNWPAQVWFRDSLGDLCLVGPHQSTGSLGMGPGSEGRVRFHFAIAGGAEGVGYRRIHALRSQIEGLEEWMPLSSISHERLQDAGGEATDVLTMRRRSDVTFGRTLNATLQPTYRFTVSPVPGQSVIEDKIVVRTGVARPRDWDEHIRIHRALRALLVVAGWRDYGFRSLEAQRKDDPLRALARNVLGERWALVHTYALPSPLGPEQKRNQFLFDFDDIGARGLNRWMKLIEIHRRGIQGMIHSVELPGVALETAVAEVGSALEYIGHGIAIEQNASAGQSLRTHLRRITGQLQGDIGFDTDAWVLRFADAYASVKHPDRPDWDTIDLADVLREARLVFRVWTASRLGVEPATLERNLPFIPMGRKYQRL
jgi:hypothetical protein